MLYLLTQSKHHKESSAEEPQALTQSLLSEVGLILTPGSG